MYSENNFNLIKNFQNLCNRSTMRLYILLITFALLVSMGESQTVGCGQTGAFCGRGPNRVNCCRRYHCNIAPNDAYAYCVRNSGSILSE